MSASIVYDLVEAPMHMWSPTSMARLAFLFAFNHVYSSAYALGALTCRNVFFCMSGRCYTAMAHLGPRQNSGETIISTVFATCVETLATSLPRGFGENLSSRSNRILPLWTIQLPDRQPYLCLVGSSQSSSRSSCTLDPSVHWLKHRQRII